MRRFGLLTLATLWFPALMVLAAPAEAEWFADLYAGGAFTQKEDVEIRELGTTLTLKDIEFDNSFAIGGRAGYWFDALPFLGLGVDVSHFRPDVASQTVDATLSGLPAIATLLEDIDVRVVAIALDVMLRWPLMKSADFPNGRLQPYATVGPAVFITEAEVLGESDTDTSLGFKAGAGVAFLLTKHLGIFGEYRFTHFNPEFKFTSGGVSTKIETDINTHHLVAGVTFRF
jgi:opacity protein-like surface antigen